MDVYCMVTFVNLNFSQQMSVMVDSLAKDKLVSGIQLGQYLPPDCLLGELWIVADGNKVTASA
jgi:hypothetical protein